MNRRLQSALCVSLVMGCVGLPAGSSGSGSQRISDDFESGELSTDKWYLKQAVLEKIEFDNSAPWQGQHSLVIGVDESIQTCESNLKHGLLDARLFDDKGVACPSETSPPKRKVCQRNEIRVAKNRRVRFGTRSWYGFSFKVSGDIEPCGSARWVIGQWKQENGDSPFLAQRFDNGVFHISVQDGHCRCRITKAEGDPDISVLIAKGKPIRCVDTEEKSPTEGKQCKTDLVVEYGPDPVLPDPGNDKWVQMVYGVRGGRDGRGEIEIYADRKFIARVTGPIGYEHGIGRLQYFKIGNYRQLIPGEATVHVDAFWRSDRKPF